MKELKTISLAILLTTINGALCSAQSRPTKSELQTAYNQVMDGKDCAKDLEVCDNTNNSLSMQIDELNKEIQDKTTFIDSLIAENDRLAKENYALVAGIATKTAEVKYKKPFGLSAVGGYGLTGSGQSGFVGVGVSWTPKFLRF